MFPFQLEGLDARKGPRLILFKTLRPKCSLEKEMACHGLSENETQLPKIQW